MMGRLWKSNVLLIISILALTKGADDDHEGTMRPAWAAAIISPDNVLADHSSRRRIHDLSARQRQRRQFAQSRLTAEQENDFTALVEAGLGDRTVTTNKTDYVVACFGALLSPRHILAFYNELTDVYWMQLTSNPKAVIKTYRIQAPVPTNTPVLVSNPSVVIPFPGAVAGNQSNVNSFFVNGFAMIELPQAQALVPGNGVGFIRVATDVDGSGLASGNMINISGLFNYQGSSGIQKVNATVSGIQCPASENSYGGTLDSRVAACVNISGADPGSCSAISQGSSVVVLGEDGNQYLVALTRFYKGGCSGTVVGVSVAFSSHKDFICSFTGINCGNAGPVPTTTTALILNNTSSSSTPTKQSKTTTQVADGNHQHQDPPKLSKFWSILQFLTAGLGK